MHEQETNTSKNLSNIFIKTIENDSLKKYSNFLSLPNAITYIKDIFDRYNTARSYDKRLYDEVNSMIDYESYKKLPSILHDGYKPTNKQRAHINKYINKRLDYSGTKELLFVEKHLNLGFTLDNITKEKYLYKMLINDKIYNVDNLFSLDRISETNEPLIITHYTWDKECKELLDKQDVKLEAFTNTLKEYIQSSDFYNTQLHNLVKAKSKNKKHYLYTDPYKHLINIFTNENREVVLKNMPYEKFMKFVDKLKVIYPSYEANVLMSEIKKIIDEYYKNGAENTTVKSAIIKTPVKSVQVKHEVKQIEHIALENLPEISKNIIKDINELYSNIKKNNAEDFDVDNLFEKRLPEVLDKYFKIAEKYRDNLKNNEGNTAQDLLIESLENIRSNFDKKWENINMQALSSLSATNKYTRKFK